LLAQSIIHWTPNLSKIAALFSSGGATDDFSIAAMAAD
jgi:hypothetical protein